jgi:hypothetical protein
VDEETGWRLQEACQEERLQNLKWHELGEQASCIP